MIEHTVLAIFCAAGVGFMIYVFFSLRSAMRRERRDRLGATDGIHRQRSKSSTSTLMNCTGRETNALGEYETPAIRSIQKEFPSIRPDLQPLSKGSSGGAR